MEDLTLLIRRGEAVALIGPNGAGKSTLVKTIVGDLDLMRGHIDIGDRVAVGYFSQEHEELHGNWTLLQEIINHTGYGEEQSRNVLGHFLFKGDEVFKTIDSLSGGEKARLALLKLFLEGDNFLILDELTNHLDIPTREVLEDALQQFGGTYLVISHDRYFLDKIAKRILILEKGEMTEYLGNFSYYKEKEREEAERQALLAQEQVAVVINNKDAKNKNISADTRDEDFSLQENTKMGTTETNIPNSEKKSIRGQRNDNKPMGDFKREKLLAKVEQNIAQLEATLKMYEVQINDPSLAQNVESLKSVSESMEKTNQELEKAYEEWESLFE